jgi:outer membrane protein assembly factor BamB
MKLQRIFNIVALALALASGHWPLATGHCSAADWPQFLGPNRNCTSSETGLRLEWPKEGPPKLWEKKLGEGFSAPVVVGEQVIVFHRLEDKEVVECLEAATGKDVWRFDYKCDYRDDYNKGDGPRATPAVAGGHVYTLGADGQLHGIELATGKKVWGRSLHKDYDVRKGFFGVATSPLVEGDRVLLNVGGKNAGIVAFDAKTGKEVWKATNDEASYSSPVAATIGGVRHVFFFTRAGILSVDPANVQVRFSKPWRARINASVNAAVPVVVDDLLFISAEYGTGAVLLEVKKDGATEVWKAPDVLSNHYNTSVHHGGYLYGIDGRQEGGAQLRCVELKTGKVRWTHQGFGVASLLLAEGHLITLCENGELALIEATPDAFREKARVKVLTGPCRAELALANGRLYARDNTKLICLNLQKK